MAIVNTFLTWWLERGRYSWSRFRRRMLERGYLKLELPVADSLEELQDCLKQITWTMDGPLHLFDCISYPQATWAKRKDDCDGFATLACELLKRMDASFSPVLVTAMVRPVRKSHTVCVFRAYESLQFFDNGILRSGCETYARVVEKITEGAEKLVCWDVRTHDEFALIEFHKHE